MEIKLTKKPKGVTIVEGFPGFGLVGTIATEFLIDHLDTEMIGKVWMEELPAIAAIHQEKIVEPLGVFYNKKYNLVIVHGLGSAQGLEWKVADAVKQIAKTLEAKEVISLEGVGSPGGVSKNNVFYYTTNKKISSKFEKSGAKPLKEGIIMGVTGALLLRSGGLPISCVFGETHSKLPDSKAAAKVIEVLDAVLGLKVDTKPLLKQAVKFEAKVKTLLDQGQKMTAQQRRKKLSYVG